MGSVPAKRKYTIGDRVRNINHDHACHGMEGMIEAVMPYMFVAPAYYVRYDSADRTIAVSERSLEKVEAINDKS